MTLRGEGVELRGVDIRYAWPSEIDLMARLTGFELEDRWGGWQREPFTAASVRRIVEYRRSA